jgi:hypothetical protein
MGSELLNWIMEDQGISEACPHISIWLSSSDAVDVLPMQARCFWRSDLQMVGRYGTLLTRRSDQIRAVLVDTRKRMYWLRRSRQGKALLKLGRSQQRLGRKLAVNHSVCEKLELLDQIDRWT